MARCRDCGERVVWAVLKGGKDDGKKRPFDPDASDTGRYGLSATEEKDGYGNQVIEAVYYDDPLKGLENHEELFNNHHFTCKNRTPRGGGVGSLNAGPKVFVSVQIGADDYSGYLSKVAKESEVKKEEVPF